MPAIQKFEDLRVWKEARSISKWFWQVVESTDLKNDFKLRGQADGSIGSVMDNIAEGFERNGRREFIQFLSIAKGSSGEFRSQLYRLFDRGYIDKEVFEEKLQQLEALSKSLSSFINYLKQSENKGWKFEEEAETYTKP